MTIDKISLGKQLGSRINDYATASHKNPRFGKRIFAHFIDHTLFICVIILSVIVSSNKPEAVYFTLLGISLLLYLSKDLIKGISPGKWLMGLKVTTYKNREAKPVFWKLILRNITSVVPIIEFFIVGITKEQRRLTDFIFGTIVIDNKNISPLKYRLLTVLMFLLPLIFFFIPLK